MKHHCKSLLAELRRFLKLFPVEKELYNCKMYFPDFLKDSPDFEIGIQRTPNSRWEYYKCSFVVTSMEKIKRDQ